MTEHPLFENDRYVSLSPAAGSTDLPFDFQLFREDALRILRTRDGEITTIERGLDWILPLGLGDELGGTAQLVMPALEGDRYELIGLEPVERESDFVQSNGFSTEKLNADVDKLSRINIELWRELGRSLRLPFGFLEPLVEAPQDGRALMWKLVGLLPRVVNGPTADEIAAAQGNAEQASAALDAITQLLDDGAPQIVPLVGDDVETRFVMPAAGLSKVNTRLIIGGLSQHQDAYDFDGDELVLSEPLPAPAEGDDRSGEVHINSGVPSAFMVPGKGSVDPGRLITDFDDLWLTRLFPDGQLRSDRARKSDVIDLREFGFNLTGAVGTELANSNAFDRLIAHATANPGQTYRARQSDAIRWNVAKSIPRCHLRLEGARLIWTGDLSGSAAVALTFGQDVTFDRLTLEIPAGGGFRRLVDLSGRNRGEVSVEAEDQIANQGSSNLDFCVRMLGHDSKIDRVKIRNVDNGLLVWGEGGAGAPQTGSEVGEIDIENYCRGYLLRNLTGFRLDSAHARGKSPNALPDPGFNGGLLEATVDCQIGPQRLFDAGEHNWRIGGSKSGEQMARDCQFGRMISGRAGQCGVKAWSGDNELTLFGMSFGEITAFDCGLFAQADSGSPGFNDFGVMLQNMSRGSVDRIDVHARAADFSALDCVYTSQMESFNIGAINGTKAARNILRISEFNGNNTDSNPTTQLSVEHVTGSEHLAEGIYLQVPTSSFRDIHVNDFQIIGGTDVLRWEGAAARAVQPCYFRGSGRGQSGALFNVPGTANIKTVDKFA